MWHEFSSTQPCVEALAKEIAQSIDSRLNDTGVCTLAVSGGRSPIPLFEALSSTDLDWARVHVRLVDERYVAPEHPDSNEALVRQYLLKGQAAQAPFQGLYAAGATVGQAVTMANTHARPVDIAILGMGDDGHTASLFPKAQQLDAALAPDAPYYVHVTPPDAPHERISMSLAALKACSRRLLYIAGTEKRAILSDAEKQVDKNLPISLLVAQPGVSVDVYWHP